jgi:DNA-binding Xre family transcriptional regulator
MQPFTRKTGISDSALHRLELGEQKVTFKTIE